MIEALLAEVIIAASKTMKETNVATKRMAAAITTTYRKTLLIPMMDQATVTVKNSKSDRHQNSRWKKSGKKSRNLTKKKWRNRMKKKMSRMQNRAKAVNAKNMTITMIRLLRRRRRRLKKIFLPKRLQATQKRKTRKYLQLIPNLEWRGIEATRVDPHQRHLGRRIHPSMIVNNKKIPIMTAAASKSNHSLREKVTR